MGNNSIGVHEGKVNLHLLLETRHGACLIF